MISKRFFLPLVLVIASGLIAAGCGGDDDTDSVATTTQTTTTNGGGGGGGGGGGSTSAAVQQVIDSCKQSVQAAPTISASTKSDLNDLCEKAGSGDVKEAQQATVQVCVEIAKDTVPGGSAQDQAVAACKAAAP